MVVLDKEATAITKSYFGFWVEKVYARYGEAALNRMRFNYAKKILNLAKQFGEKSEFLEVVALNWYGFNEIKLALIYEDMYMLIGTMAASILYMTIHMKSFYLAFLSVINLFFAIPVTLCIYTYIVGIHYFSTIHVAVLIVVIGIGADDVFVFHDFWIGSHKIKLIRKSIKQRLAYTFRKAS